MTIGVGNGTDVVGDSIVAGGGADRCGAVAAFGFGRIRVGFRFEQQFSKWPGER